MSHLAPALSILSLLGATGAIAGCSSEATTTEGGQGGLGGLGGAGGAGGTAGAGGAGGAAVSPGPGFDRFCGGDDWTATATPAKAGALGEAYVGVIAADPPFPEGTLETMKVIPEHPFYVKTIRVAFGRGAGEDGASPGLARIRLMTSFGRSYPGGWPEIETESENLVPPIDVEVPGDPDPDAFLELDVSELGVFLAPTQHYFLVYEHLTDDAPLMAVEAVPEGEWSRTLIHLPGEELAYGLDGHYRMELAGEAFCPWTTEERWFGEVTSPELAAEPSARATLSDVDGDGHDDLLVHSPGPVLYLGDGALGFAKAPFDPFPDAPAASMMVFGDLDNDGDRDAFAATYVSSDGDGDGTKLVAGDCDDTDPAVEPGKPEVTNGRDDDCDGTADDGTDTSDGDADGTSIAAGDCDDTRADVSPLAAEVFDGRDNDCDGATDEGFQNLVLLNDGTGQFTAVASSGVESQEPTTAAALLDADGDGALDVYWGNWLVHYPDFPAIPGRFFTGNGDGTFVDAQAAAGMTVNVPRPTYGVLAVDYDDDLDQDVFVGNYQLSDNLLWQNQGDGTFVNAANEANVAHDDIKGPYSQYPGGHTYGGDFGDVDGDGDLDLFWCNLSHPRVQPWSDPSMFYLSSGAPDYGFTDHREALGVIYDEGDVNAMFGDFDNDGDLDLVVATLYTGHFSKLYRNDGDAGFVDVTYEANVAVHDAVSALFSDLDEDGDLDLVIADRAGLPNVHVFENRASKANAFLEVDLVSTSGNRDAVGARVWVTSGGATQLREQRGGGGHSNAQPSHWLHFGLGAAQAIDELTVRWPSGAVETFSGAAVRQRYRLVEGTGVVQAP